MPFDERSEKEHEFPAGPTNNYDPYYDDDEYAEDYLDWDEDDDYGEYNDDDDIYYDGFPNYPYYDESTRLERFRWRLSSLWWKVRHPIPELQTMRRAFRWRWFTHCQVDGCCRRGTVDGMLCSEHWLPF